MSSFIYIFRLVRLVLIRYFILLSACILLSIGSVAIELFAMTILYPLTQVAINVAPPAGDMWVSLLGRLGLKPGLKELLLAFTIIFSIRILTLFISRSLSIYLGKRLQTQFSSEAFFNILTGYELREINEKSIGYYITLAGDEVARAANILVTLVEFLSQIVLAVLYFLAICNLSLIAGIGILAFMFMSFLFLLPLFRRTHLLGQFMIAQQQMVHSVFLDSLNGYRSVKTFLAESFVVKEYGRLNKKYMFTQFLIEWYSLLIRMLPALFLLLTFTVFLFFCVPDFSKSGPFNGFVVITLVIYMLRFFPVVGLSLNIGVRVIADAKSGHDIMDIISVAHRNVRPRTALLHDPVRRIEINNISFSYDGNRKVFDGFNARFEQGRSYVLAGASGTGKSTLVDLILNFYPTGSGAILIDGIPIDDIDLTCLRTRIILLSQQITIFNDSVSSNISFGAKYSSEQIKAAAQAACIDEFIQSLPDQYDTILNYQGSNLSGGQRQRIGLARALIRNPDVLILDECTSALDAQTRDSVVENIVSAYKNRIVIFISHDHWLKQQVNSTISILEDSG